MDELNTARPKILVFFTYGVSLKDWEKSGIVTREVEIYRRLIERGFDITFFTYGDESDFSVQGIPEKINIFPVYAHSFRHTNRYVRFFQSLLFSFSHRRVFKKSQIYKTNQMSGGLLAALCAFLYGKPLLVRCGFEMLRSMIREGKTHLQKVLAAIAGYLFEALVYAFADRIVITSFNDLAFIMSAFPYAKKKSKVLMNYIDVDLFIPAESLPIETRILFVGRLESCKNIFSIITASVMAGAGLDIVGDGPLRKSLENHARKIGADVIFHGRIPNNSVPEIMRQHRFFILPSEYEGNPKSLLEAMSCGLVVIGSDVDGIRELINDGRNGFLSATDHEAVADTIKKVMSIDKSRLEMISRSARRFVLSECSLKNTVIAEERLYRSMLLSVKKKRLLRR